MLFLSSNLVIVVVAVARSSFGSHVTKSSSDSRGARSSFGSPMCLDPGNPKDFMEAVSVSDVGVVGILRHVDNKTNPDGFTVTVQKQTLLPQWIFGSPRECCRQETYKINVTKQGGEGVECLEGLNYNDHSLLFLMRAFKNYTGFELVAKPQRNYTGNGSDLAHLIGKEDNSLYIDYNRPGQLG